MPEINLCNEAGRDAVVNMENVAVPVQVRWVDAKGRGARNIRILKSTLEHDIQALHDSAAGIENVHQLLIEGDPEIDIETMGSYLNTTSRVYINPERQLVHKIQQFEIIRNPDGTQRDRRAKERAAQNVSSELPLKWSGVYLKRAEVIRKFVFAAKMQIMHINGLTYDFLYAMAKSLEQRDSMLLLGAGPKANQPLILRRGSVPYRGFLEGRTRGDSYLLVLHLSNLELKVPEETSQDDG